MFGSCEDKLVSTRPDGASDRNEGPKYGTMYGPDRRLVATAAMRCEGRLGVERVAGILVGLVVAFSVEDAGCAVFMVEDEVDANLVATAAVVGIVVVVDAVVEVVTVNVTGGGVVVLAVDTSSNCVP